MLSLRTATPKLLLAAAVLIGTQTGCERAARESESAPTLGLASASFSGDLIPRKHTCDGTGGSPELSWKEVPARTQSLAVTVTDPDSPLAFALGPFVHWVLYDLGPDRRELPEAVPTQALLPDGSRQGKNGFGNVGYGGPCPPGSSPHRYVFDVYALDSRLALPAGATMGDVTKAMQGHILARGTLIGRYQR